MQDACDGHPTGASADKFGQPTHQTISIIRQRALLLRTRPFLPLWMKLDNFFHSPKIKCHLHPCLSLSLSFETKPLGSLWCVAYAIWLVAVACSWTGSQAHVICLYSASGRLVIWEPVIMPLALWSVMLMLCVHAWHVKGAANSEMELLWFCAPRDRQINAQAAEFKYFLKTCSLAKPLWLWPSGVPRSTRSQMYHPAFRGQYNFYNYTEIVALWSSFKSKGHIKVENPQKKKKKRFSLWPFHLQVTFALVPERDCGHVPLLKLQQCTMDSITHLAAAPGCGQVRTAAADASCSTTRRSGTGRWQRWCPRCTSQWQHWPPLRHLQSSPANKGRRCLYKKS